MVAMSEENPSIEPSSTMEQQQQAASDTDAELRDAADPVASDDATKTEAAEADQDQDLDLDQEEQEKQPMTGGADRSEDAPSAASESAAADAAAVCEKNGALKLKIQEEEEEEVKFTGLTKEELLRVAGTPGWVRTRWALLVVFWVGWLGILAGAVLIIVKAPRCRDLPPTSWWNDGPLYQLGDVQVFSESRNLKGVEQKVNSLSKLKVKGLVLGPIHVAPSDDPMNVRFEEISPDVGNLEQFRGLIQAAHRKSISVVLDLTPNYRGTLGPWFANVSVTNVAERLKSALVFWLNEGVDGVQLSGVERVADIVPSLWADIRAIVQDGVAGQTKRVLIGITESSSAEDVSSLLSSTRVDLLISRVLSSANDDGVKYAESVQTLYSSHSQLNLAWSMGRPAEGHLASMVGPALVKLYQLMLLTLPGTPFINYGDEIGLVDEATKFPKMLWDAEEEVNGTQQEQRDQRLSSRTFFQTVSELRGKERSLLFGDFVLLSNSSSSMSYLRLWDQSVRYVAAFNWAEEATVLQLTNAVLPQRALVVVSTNSTALPADTSVDLSNLQLGPGQAVLVQFPYTA